jgi:hypothetical protein
MPESGIRLADLVDAVRRELEEAAHEARDRQLQFDVQDVQLEVEIATTRTGEGEGGVKVLVLNLGGKYSEAHASTQRVTLRLQPVTAEGTRFTVSDLTDKPVSDN